MEFLKAHLGDELYGQVAAKLKDSKVKLADLAPGEYVGKGKHEALEGQLKTAQATIAERDKQLETLKKADPEKLQAEITRLQGENTTVKADAEKQISALKLDTDVQAYTAGIKFTSDLARKAFVAEFKAQGFKQDEQGKFLGADDYAKGVREKNPSAFEQEAKGGAGFGGKEPPGTAATTNQALNDALRGALRASE